MKEATDFYNRIKIDKEAQDKKFETESQVETERFELCYVDIISIVCLVRSCKNDMMANLRQ